MKADGSRQNLIWAAGDLILCLRQMGASLPPRVCVSGSGVRLGLNVEAEHCLGVDRTQFGGANPHCPLHVLLDAFYLPSNIVL